MAKSETHPERMGKIKFLVDQTVEDHTGRVTQSFNADEVYELPESICQRWLRRNVAERVESGDFGKSGLRVESVIDSRPGVGKNPNAPKG